MAHGLSVSERATIIFRAYLVRDLPRRQALIALKRLDCGWTDLQIRDQLRKIQRRFKELAINV